MIEYLQYFFNPSHIFSLRPPVMSVRAVVILAVIFGLFIIFGIVNKIMTGKNKSGLKALGQARLFYLFITMGILGYVYTFFAAQGVILLSSRLWLLLIFLITAVWLGFVAVYIFITVPKKQRQLKKKQEFEKYIP